MFSTALDREAAWLNTTNDGLPTLPGSNGGPFQIIQPRWPRRPATMKTAIYVLRATTGSFHYDRYASQRTIGTTAFMLRVLWPVTSGTGSAESDQLAFEQAIDSLLTRIAGPLGDKTHGQRFLSVAEDRQGVTVHLEDAEQMLTAGIYRATVTYSADDPDLIN